MARVKVRYHDAAGLGPAPGVDGDHGVVPGAVWSVVAYGAIWVANFSWRDDVDEYYTLTARQERWISLGATTAAVFAMRARP